MEENRGLQGYWKSSGKSRYFLPRWQYRLADRVRRLRKGVDLGRSIRRRKASGFNGYSRGQEPGVNEGKRLIKRHPPTPSSFPVCCRRSRVQVSRRWGPIEGKREATGLSAPARAIFHSVPSIIVRQSLSR